jgi:restriction system protein
MARKHPARVGSRKQCKQNLQQELIGLFLLGLAFVTGPAFVGNPVLHNTLGALRTAGWIMMVAAAAAVGLHQLIRRAATPATNPTSLSGEAGSSQAKVPQTATSHKPLSQADTPQARAFSAARAASASTGTAVPDRPTAWGPAVFDVIEWRRFEALCERLFAQAGFETKSQSHGADEGIDIWLYSNSQPDTAVSLVQCKCWATRPVKVAEVRALLGSMAAKKVKRGVFATTSGFSTDAAQFCKSNGIHMLDRADLLNLIAKRTPQQQGELLAVATDGEFWIPTCASCGTKMIRRTPKRGGNDFWGCVSYPRCKTVMSL